MKQRLLFLVLLSVMLGLSGCNLWEFTGPSDNPSTLKEDGKQLMRDGDYQGAMEKFEEGLQDDPYNSELLFLHAKAAMKLSEVNVLDITTTISTLDTEGETESRSDLPFMNLEEWPNPRANSLYQGVQVAGKDLKMINDGLTTGIIEPQDIRLDLSILLAVKGFLIFRDTNLDNSIDDSDWRLDVFFDEDGELNIDSLATMDPEHINELLDNLIDLMKTGGEVMDDFLGDLLGGEETGIDEEDLDRVMDNVANGSDEYRIEYGVDNDHDWTLADDLDGNGEPSGDWDGPLADANGDLRFDYDPEPHVDEEWLDGIDNDGDGLVDEDSIPVNPGGGE